jgi:hypothetical protein
MVKIEEETHWHLPSEGGISEIELIANDKQDDQTIPLTLMQGSESVWLSKEQVEALRSFIDEKVLI